MSMTTLSKSALVAVASLGLLFSSLAGAQADPHSGPVMNYHRVNDQLVTGGHLLDGGAAALKEQGVNVVINLRDDAPAEEEERFADQGIEWINIPIEWRDPKAKDFERFVEVMDKHQDDHVLVQCAANYRASAITYMYQVVVENVPEDEAAEDMHAIWDPDENDTWRQYIDDVIAGAGK